MRQLAKLWLRIDWIIWFMIAMNMDGCYLYFVTIYHRIGTNMERCDRRYVEWFPIQKVRGERSGGISSLVYIPKIIN